MKLKSKLILVFFAFLILWFLFLIVSGSLFSGYQLVDDHEILTIHNQLVSSSNNVLLVSKNIITGDLEATGRFRPFYYIHRILETRFFGTNFLLWHVYTGLLTVLTSFFFFCFFKLTKFDDLESIFLILLIQCGTQAEIWWRLGPAETVGLFFLSVSLLFLILSYYSKKSKIILEIFAIVFIVLSSLSKESFLLLIPAYIFLKFYLDFDFLKLSFSKILKKNLCFNLFILAIFIIELILLKKFLGLINIEKWTLINFNYSTYLVAAKSLFFNGYFILIILISISLVIVLISETKNPFKNKSKLFNKFLPPLILFLLIIIPQLILYSKSDLYGRYLTPGIIGSSFILILLFRYFRKRIGTEKIFNDIKKYRNNLFYSFIYSIESILFLIFLFIVLLSSVKYNIHLFVNSQKIITFINEFPRINKFLLILLLGILLFLIIILFFIKIFRIKHSKKVIGYLEFFRFYLFKTKKYIIFICVFLIITTISFNIIISYINAHDFAKSGIEVNKLFTSITNNTKNSSSILLVSDLEDGNSHEILYSVEIYFKYVLDRKNLYYFYNKDKSMNVYMKKNGSNVPVKLESYKFDVIIILPRLEENFIKEKLNWFDPKRYKSDDFNKIIVYSKLNS